MSPLSRDKETVKKYKIPKDVELHPRQKLAFLEEQLHQIKTMHFRSRIDMLHAKRMQDDKNEVLQQKGLQNYATHLNEVQQTVGAIKMLSDLIAEIKAENPGTKKDEVHPEDI